jgi:hypothetical protein
VKLSLTTVREREGEVELVEYVKLNPWKSERKYAFENSNTYFFAILQVRVKGEKVYSQSVTLQ